MIRISRRSLLATALLAAGFDRSSQADTTKPALNPAFLVVGDWGKGSSNQRRIAAEMAKTARTIQAQFVISTGDNFYPQGVEAVGDPQWKKKFEKIYDAPSLMIPWYITLGNHDHMGRIDAQLDYTKLSSRWRLPARYYKHIELLADGSEAAFFHLDTTPIKEKCKDEQLVWLVRELAYCRASWKIVVGHHPIYAGGKHGDSPELIATVKPLLERFGVQAYLNGHDHHLEHVVVGRVQYLTSGAGSKPRPAEALEGTRFVIGDRLGFMTARMSATAMDIEFVDENGVALYQTSIPVQNTAVVGASQRSDLKRVSRERKHNTKRAYTCDASAG